MFSGLISLQHICITDDWDEIINLDGIFDPSKILKFEAWEISNFD
jgi:hypothetical protein